MGKFSVIEYSGKDAGLVLARIIGGMPLDGEAEHDVESAVETAPFKTGFQPAEVEEADDDEDEGADQA